VYALLQFTTSTGAAFTVYAPPVSKVYIIWNASNFAMSLRVSDVIGSTTAKAGNVALTIAANTKVLVWSDATSFYDLQSASFAGVLPAVNGGTGQSAYAVGDLLYADTTTTLAKLADIAVGNALISGGVATAPSWGKVGLATHVSGTLPVSNGGTGQTTALTQYGVIYGSTTTAMATTLAGTSSQVLHGNASGAPTWGSVALGTEVSGTLPIANGGTNSTATPTNGGVGYGTGTAHAYSSAGTLGQVLQSNGAAAPTWLNQSSIAAGSATNASLATLATLATTATLATLATTATLATLATTATLATLATSAGFATNADTATSAGLATSAGSAGFATTATLATLATTATLATLATTATLATLATTATLATLATQASSALIRSATAQNSTSGTSIDFTGIPSGVLRVTAMFNGVSTNGSANLRLQIGAGSVQTTGYTSSFGVINGVTAGTGNDASGFGIGGAGSSGSTTSGAVILTSLGSNVWVASGSFKNGIASVSYVGGDVTLSGTLDRVRLTTSNGTDAFDAGSINILYE
jgi:hypothetical protein